MGVFYPRVEKYRSKTREGKNSILLSALIWFVDPFHHIMDPDPTYPFNGSGSFNVKMKLQLLKSDNFSSR